MHIHAFFGGFFWDFTLQMGHSIYKTQNGTSMGHNGSNIVLSMTVSGVVSEKLPGPEDAE